jgi:hypothetical protein
MAKKIPTNPNADLPPLMVLTSFLNEKKREFVTKKLMEFGLVRQEFFNRKLGHKKKEFPFKKFLGKRYRFVTAPMTDQEVDQLFQLVQTLISITPKPQGPAGTNQEVSPSLSNKDSVKKRRNKKFSFIAFLLNILGLLTLAIGGYSLYDSVLTLLAESLPILELTIALGQEVITLIVPAIILFGLAATLKTVKAIA